MAIDMFLKLGDIKGESKDSVHKEEIEIHTINWSMTQSGQCIRAAAAEQARLILPI